MIQNISEVGATLKENREKISKLEARMKTFKGEMAGLNKLVESLKLTLQEREQSIAALETSVKGLEATVAEKTTTIAEKEAVIEGQQKEMNTAYMIVGTRDELKERGVITDEGGFLWGLLGSTTVMASGVDRSMFTAIDKTRDHTIPIDGEVKEILPHRSNDYFAMGEQPLGNGSSLTITRPDGFWQNDYLVIVVD